MPESGPAVRRAALVSALLTLVARLAYPAHRLFDHDSVQFALGVLHFDLAAHQPHPPGYPLYLGLLKLLAALGVPPLAGMVALSIAAATAGAYCFALVAARLAGEHAAGAALLAGVLYAFNPLLWFYGELPLVYAVEGGLTAVLAWAALGMADGRRRFLVACLLFAAAGGVRPSTLVLLFPLFLWGLWRAWRRGGFLTWRLTLAGAALGAAVCVAWLTPLALAAGGLAAYREISGQHFATLLPVTSVVYGAGFGALAHNVEVLVKWALQGLLPAAAAVLVAWAAAWRNAPRRIGDGLRLALSRAGFLAAWAVPPILFFALFHVTKAGYTLIHLPAMLAAAVLAATPALAVARRRFVVVAVVAVAILVGAGLFVFGNDRRDDQPRWTAVFLHEHNRGDLRAYERDLDALIAALDRYPPEGTFLAAVELAGDGGAGADGFLYPYHRHLQWYAPEHPLALLVPEQGFAEATAGGRSRFHRVDGTVPVPAGVDRVVFVLARPVGERLPLPPAEVVLSNRTFHVLAVRFDGELAVGEGLRLVGEGAGEERDAGVAVGSGESAAGGSR
ncbi:MAG TPA: DUF2723 domain-containing protein [Thermoanaerobaculia bacterium]|nr:DUF2723 domain-containing protein [Thermoanaerobaculia bacterium]